MIGRTWAGIMSSLLELWTGALRNEIAEAIPIAKARKAATFVFPFTICPLLGDDQFHPHVVVATTALDCAFDQVLRGRVGSLHVVVLGTVVKTQVPSLITQRANDQAVRSTIAGLLRSALRGDAQAQHLARYGTNHRRLLVPDPKRVVAGRDHLDDARIGCMR